MQPQKLLLAGLIITMNYMSWCSPSFAATSYQKFLSPMRLTTIGASSLEGYTPAIELMALAWSSVGYPSGNGKEVLEAIENFVESRGQFTDQQTKNGITAAMFSVASPELIQIFIKAGGHYTNQQDNIGRTAAMLAAGQGADVIKAFVGAGGKFTDQLDENGQTAADWAASEDANAVVAYNEAVKKQSGLVAVRLAVDAAPPECSRLDLDTTVDIVDSADHFRTLSLNFYNQAKYACVLRKLVDIEYGYDIPARGGQPAMMGRESLAKTDDLTQKSETSPFLLNPGHTAHMSFRWKTQPSSSDAANVCHEITDNWPISATMAKNSDTAYSIKNDTFEMYDHNNGRGEAVHPILELYFSKLKMSVCSSATVSPYIEGKADGDAIAEKLSVQPQLVLSQDLTTYHTHDPVKLKLHVNDPGSVIERVPSSPSSHKCLDHALQRSRLPDGTVFYEELSEEMDCRIKETGLPGRQIDMTYEAKNKGLETNLFSELSPFRAGNQTIDVSLIGNDEAEWKVLATSNAINFHFEDPSHIKADWGKSVNGFVISLTLDKDAFPVDAHIIMHLACSRLTDNWRISGNAFGLEPCDAGIELRNIDGSLVKYEDGRPLGKGYFETCGGSSSGPLKTLNVEKVAIERKELILDKDCVTDASDAAEGFFLNHPGTYTATAVWYGSSENPEVKEVVRSKQVTFRIIEN